MKISLKIWSWAVLGAILTAGGAGAQYGPPTPQTSVPAGGNQTRFMCETMDSQSTVTYHPVDRPGDKYPWAVPSTMGSSWSANKRCTEIARRLEEYRRDGLKELRTEVKNQYDTVCVTTEKNSECRIVFTIPKGQDAITTRDSVFRNLTVADSGQQTVGVNTFADGGKNGLNGILGNILPGIGGNPGVNAPAPTRAVPKDSIDLRPFLSIKDGGTGVKLRAPAAVPAVKPQTVPTGAKKLDSGRFW
jgi:Circadian oscillating protein COP23